MKVELVKNDQFFGASDVKLDGVEFSIITDSQTAALSFENGDLDVDILSEKVKEATRLIKLCKEKLYKADEEVKKVLEELE